MQDKSDWASAVDVKDASAEKRGNKHHSRRTWSVTLDLLPDSRLSANSRRRIHWSDQRKYTLATQDAFVATLRSALHGTRKPQFGRCKVKWTLIYPEKRNRDYDGVWSSLKPWIDVLVSEGILEADDSEHIVEASLAIKVERGTKGTILEIASNVSRRVKYDQKE